ncbi:BON1-associated protein [Trifolium repens]|nr:BON1-associated protein [Trifolium repens]
MAGKQQACTLEITIISGQKICIERNSKAEDVYVVVRAESLNSCTTKMVNENEGLLSWEEKFMLDIPSHAKSVTFEVQCKKYKGARPIGVARVALSDFLGNNMSLQSCAKNFSYGLRDWDGRKNGVINFSVREVTQEGNLCFDSLEKEQVVGEKKVSSSEFEDANDKNKSSHVAIGISILGVLFLLGHSLLSFVRRKK